MDILDLFLPKGVKCIFCGRETKEYGICKECYSHLPFVTGITCHKCGATMSGKGYVCVECKNKKTEIDRNYAVLNYDDLVKSKVISFKQGGVKYIGDAFAHLMREKYDVISENIDIIIPVPLSKNRLKSRGFNQSEVLCNELTELNKVRTDILARPEDTPHQTGLDRKNRLSNLKGAFKVNDKKAVRGRSILLVDDIYTTGTTLNECASALKSAGASKVYGLVLARAMPRMDRVLGKEKETIEDKITSLALGGH